MVSITSKQGVKAFFRGENEVVIQYGAMEFSVQVGANMKIKCNGTLEIEAGAIKITAQRDVDIQARGATNIDSTQNVNIGSDSDVKVNALNIVNTARVGFVGKGTASSELSAGGQTTVKGAMVMIN